MLETTKQTILKYYLLGSALALAILYFLFDRRGRQLREAHADAQITLLGQQLQTIQQQSMKDESSYEKSKTDYQALVARHSDLLAKYNLKLGSNEPPAAG